MQKQYPKKLRKILNQSKNIIPTQYQLFYTLLKQICNNIQNQDITPELLNSLSEIYHTCKQALFQNCQISTLEPNNTSQHPYTNTHKFLHNLLQPILKYLPQNDQISKLLYKHFMDSQFYNTITTQKQKAQNLIISTLGINNMSQSGNMTPLAFPKNRNKGVQYGSIGINSNNSNSSGSGSSGSGDIRQLKLNELIRYQHTNNTNTNNSNRLHINGNNQLSIIFWLNCFKFDYAVHFDIFWQFFQNYLNTILTLLPQSPTKPHKQPTTPTPCIYYPNIIPNTNNINIKQKIKQIVDINNKYYITSANCNQLFVVLNQPEFINQLSELTIKKEVVKEEFKSTCCINLVYRWKGGKSGLVSVNNYNNQPIGNNLHDQPLSPLSPTTTYLKTLKQSQQIPENKQIFITGTSIGYNTKIMHNKYPPTIRFGSLQDNQIVIKNKYISRRQFMIIQELEDKEDGDAGGYGYGLEKKYESNYSTRQREISTSDKCIMQSAKILKQSVYYLVCLSPSNHTTLIYNHRMEVRSGLIFKINGIYIQIVRFMSVYGGRDDKNRYLAPIKQRQQQQQSILKINNISQSNQSSQPENNNQSQFQLLTSIPICKTQQNQQQSQKTLEQLPTNKSQLIISNQLQCMYISGENKNKKFSINGENRRIRVGEDCVFQFEIQDGMYYVPKGTEILAKCANQVLSGHFSDKVRLRVGMKIVLEEIQFLIVE